MDSIDVAISQVEKLYQSVTGLDAPTPGDTPYATIPPERDPYQFVEAQMERLLSMLGAVDRRIGQSAPWAPAASAWESPDAYMICVDLPGVSPRSVKVSVARNTVEIEGERPQPAPAEFTPRQIEGPAGPFRRSIPLPSDAQAERLEAEFDQGVLTLRVARVRGEARRVVVK